MDCGLQGARPEQASFKIVDVNTEKTPSRYSQVGRRGRGGPQGPGGSPLGTTQDMLMEFGLGKEKFLWGGRGGRFGKSAAQKIVGSQNKSRPRGPGPNIFDNGARQ